MLTGSTKPAQRLKMVNSFNGDDTSVFLISLKAGGTGLNLTGADVVIHYDRGGTARLKIKLPTALTVSGRRKTCRYISSSPGIPSRRRYASCSRQNPGLRISYSAEGRTPEIS